MDTLNVLDLFSGVGGFSLGLENTGGFKTIGFCEQDPYCRAVLKRHWPDVPQYPDVRLLSADQMAVRPDVLTGGFPCQDISWAGKRAGLSGPKSRLWQEYLRIIREAKCKYAVIENVGRLVSGGLQEVLQGLSKIGYDAEWQVIPGWLVGSPQVRERVFIVAYPMRCSECSGRQAGLPWCRWFERGSGSTGQVGQDGWNCTEKTNVQLWPEPPLDRVAYGIPSRVDGNSRLGNAIIPAIAENIGRLILAREASCCSAPHCLL